MRAGGEGCLEHELAASGMFAQGHRTMLARCTRLPAPGAPLDCRAVLAEGPAIIYNVPGRTGECTRPAALL